MKKIIFSENIKREIAQGATFLFLFLFVGFLAYDKNIKPEYVNLNTPTLTSSVVSVNSFNYDCLEVWLKTNKEVSECSVNSYIFKIKSFTFDNEKAIQIIRSHDRKQVGEEMIFIETLNSWRRENGPATKEDIEMMSELKGRL